jgi:hypothetical protein
MSPTNRLLIQVVAQLKPGRCGVSDHAILLAEDLEKEFGVNTAFVVLNSNEPCELRFPRIYCSPSELLESCEVLSEGKPASLLLHYSGYGFSQDGAPAFIPGALDRVRKSGKFRVGVYFHELFASSMPWRSAFWHQHRQKQVVREIVRQCDFVATNLSRHSDWLAGNTPQGSDSLVRPLPVFSNAGEDMDISPMRARRPAMVVFGLPNTRRESYGRLLRLVSMLNDLGIKEILDVGPAFDSPVNVGEIPVTRLGELDVADLGNLFSKTMFGFVPHPSFCLAKSGIFASLCANGTVPVLGESFSGQVDGLKDGIHLVSPRTAKVALAGGIESCSTAAWHWYSGHRRHVHSATYSRWLIQPSTQDQTIGRTVPRDTE